jgi:tetratricopeptide (TPR) repeat protein
MTLSSSLSGWEVTPRRLVRLAVMLAVLGLLVSLLVYVRRTQAPPPPPLPEVRLDDAEPAVRAAVESARQRVIVKPDSAAAWGLLGKVLLAHAFLEPAAACFLQAETRDPDEPRWPYFRCIALHERDEANSLACLKRAVELCDRFEPKETAPRLLLAEALLMQGKEDEAREQLRRVQVRDPQNPRLRFHLGVLALKANDPQTALSYLEPLADHPSARRRACAQLAMLHRRQGQEEKAAEYGKRALRPPADQPWDDPYADEYSNFNVGSQRRLQQAQSLDERKRYQEASEVLAAVARERPSEITAFAVGVNLAKQGRFPEAEAALRQLVAHHPDSSEGHYTLGTVLYYQGETIRLAGGNAEKARDKFRETEACERRATRLKPDHAFAHVYLGRSLFQLGNPEEALAALRHAETCRPESVGVLMYLGEALAQAGKVEEGVKHLELAVQLAAADDPKPLMAKAAVLAAQGKDAEALALLDKATQVAPDDPAPRAALNRLKEKAFSYN